VRARPLLLGIVAITLAFSGCLDSLFGATVVDYGAPAELASVLACPPGQRLTRFSGSPCVGTFEAQDAHLVEPNLAVDPSNPLRMALGANAVSHIPLLVFPGPVPAVPGVPMGFNVDVFVSEDGGARWRRTTFQAPHGPGQLPFGSGDPSLAFDREGRLHVSFLGAFGTPSDYELAVVYTSSDDLGVTWSEPVVFRNDVEFNDRNWLTAGEDGSVYITWSALPQSSAIAWSLDRGATWSNRTDVTPGCPFPSHVTFLGGTPSFACTREYRDIDLFRFDPETGNATRFAIAPRMFCILPRLFAPTNDTLTVACYGGSVATSLDGGQTWRGPVLPFAFTKIDDEWESRQFLWSDVDPWSGQLHLLVGPYNNTKGAKPMAHLVMDPVTLKIIEETVLVPDGAPRRNPTARQWENGDDFMTMAFTPDRGILMWTYDGAPDFAYVVPLQAVE